MSRRSPKIHERFLRHIWSRQYLKGALKVVDGRSLTVLDVGQLNSGGGPDFCHAKIQLDGVTYRGDVEIHRTAFEWFQHQHQEDPHYNKVILHVVLETVSTDPPTYVHSKREIPVLVLGTFLSDSIQTIWRKAILDERSQRLSTIPCFENNNSLTGDQLQHAMTKLSVERLELKLRRFEEQLKQLAHERRMTVRDVRQPYGGVAQEVFDEIPPPLPDLTVKDLSEKKLWEQILYEGVMEGLGYSKNRDPFLRLAQSVTLEKNRELKVLKSRTSIEALFFGAAGLIPKIKSIKQKESRMYVRSIAREWKTIRTSFRSEILHAADWQFSPARPSNFPTVRLAAAAALLPKFIEEDFFRHTIQTLKAGISVQEKHNQLMNLFSHEVSPFWKQHCTFEHTMSKPVTALGAARIQGIVVNTLLPVGLLYARVFKDRAVRAGALDVYSHLPAFDDNSITRLMEKQLLKGKLSVRNISQQQALLQLYNYYCAEKQCASCTIYGRMNHPS